MQISNRRTFVFASAIFILVTGNGVGAAGQQYPLPVPTGVPVVSVADSPKFGTIPLILERDRVLADEANDEQAFSQIFGLDVDAWGNLYVLDLKEFRLSKLDPEGRVLWRAGRKGEGPGEFRQPMRVDVNAAGSVVVFEAYGRSVVHEFSAEGRFVRTVGFSSTSLSAQLQGLLGADALLFRVAARTEAGSREGFEVMGWDGKKKRSVLDVSSPPLDPPIRGVMLYNPYTPSLLSAVFRSGGGIIARNTDPRLLVLDSQGVPAAVWERKRPVLRVTAKDRDEVVERYLKGLNRAKLTREETRRGYAFDRFDFKPISFRILTDDLDRIYVQDWTPASAGNADRRFEVFSREGVFLFATKIPYNAGVIRAGFLYSRERDADSGYSRIVRWRVDNWKSLPVGP